MIFAAILSLAGCDISTTTETTATPEPTIEELNLAIEKAIRTLNQKTGSSISKLSFDSIEVPEVCFGEIDYFAQQLILHHIYYPNHVFRVDCRLVPTKDDEIKI